MREITEIDRDIERAKARLKLLRAEKRLAEKYEEFVKSQPRLLPDAGKEAPE